MSRSAIGSELRRLVFARDEGRCRYCCLNQIGQAATFHINHVRPRSRGGTTDAENLVLQCPWCSLHKSDKVTAMDSETGTWVPLMHPLRHNWATHIAIQTDGRCVGLTSTGRATIGALRMNDELPLTARAMQIRLGLLPPS